MRIVFVVMMAFLTSLCTALSADTLLIPISQQGNDSIVRPTRGMTMAQVTAQFGPALKQQGPVGQPAITRWFYADFNVTFENDHVVQSVIIFVAKNNVTDNIAPESTPTPAPQSTSTSATVPVTSAAPPSSPTVTNRPAIFSN